MWLQYFKRAAAAWPEQVPLLPDKDKEHRPSAHWVLQVGGVAGGGGAGGCGGAAPTGTA